MAVEKEVRLQKYLADCGVASRRKSEELIANGAVRVNGKMPTIGDKVRPSKDKITVRGERVVSHKRMVYIMVHKPRGVVTTMSDEMDRKCIAELVKNVGVRVYPIGRLDRDSEGLILMTNDGAFAQLMAHPTYHIPKTYRVTVRPTITDEQITALTVGMMIDGRQTAPAEVRVITKEEGRVVVEIVLYEGRNRQIRKMCEQLGLDVARLKRVSIGNVKMGMLKVGDWRALSDQELANLNHLGKLGTPH